MSQQQAIQDTIYRNTGFIVPWDVLECIQKILTNEIKVQSDIDFAKQKGVK